MTIITCDYETYYDQQYSLRKMSEVEYILDHRFQTIMASIQEGDAPGEIFVGHDAVARRLAKIDWSKAAFLAHNTRFDGAILAWRYGIIPALYLDTVSMARALTHSVVGKSSLDAVSKYLGLPDKGTAVHNAMGMRLENFSATQLQEYADYCQRDRENCRTIFDTFMRVFPKSELRLIDSVLRMFIEPQIKLDPDALALHLNNVQAESARIMATVSHIDPSTFSSNAKFAELLGQRGVEVPRKISPTTGLETWALARNDRAFKELCSDESQPLEVQALLAARLNSKSTLEETKTARMLKLSLQEWPAPMAIPDVDQDTYLAAHAHGLIPGRGRGWAPVPLKYAGAHTGRLSGDGGFNWQNPRRGSPIKDAMIAPPGYRIVHRDASQIEVRMLAVLARCQKLITIFHEKRDPYAEFASIVYGRKITRADTKERFVGKTCILGLGYQTGPAKLRHTLFIGNGGVSVNVDEREAARYVYTYRDTYSEIPELWKKGDTLIAHMMRLAQPWTQLREQRKGMGFHLPAEPYPVVVTGRGCVWMPNGLCINYPGLRQERGVGPTGSSQIENMYNLPYGGSSKLYGGKITENIDQGLSRIVITDIIERVRKQTGYHPWLTTHDSLDYCVPEAQAKDFDALLEYEFSIPPPWAPDLPLSSDGGWGLTLLKAENKENV